MPSSQVVPWPRSRPIAGHPALEQQGARLARPDVQCRSHDTMPDADRKISAPVDRQKRHHHFGGGRSERERKDKISSHFPPQRMRLLCHWADHLHPRVNLVGNPGVQQKRRNGICGQAAVAVGDPKRKSPAIHSAERSEQSLAPAAPVAIFGLGTAGTLTFAN